MSHTNYSTFASEPTHAPTAPIFDEQSSIFGCCRTAHLWSSFKLCIFADESTSVSGALRAHWRAVLGEVVATALLVLLGVAACLPMLTPTGDVAPPLAHPALAFGFVVLCNVEVFGPVSGAHMNPAVTLAAVLTGHSGPLLAVAYVIAQILGAVLGFAALQALAPSATGAAGVTLPAPGVSALAAAGVEAVLTGLLALLCCALWTAPPPADRSVPIKFGLTIAGLVYAGGALTGASLNPARSLAPALLQGVWDHHWVYWVGPLGGAALFTLLHRFVLAPAAHRAATPAAAPAAPHEELPLNDKTNC